jgi:hypothetical protein
MREAAKHRLPRGIFEFVDRATEDHLAVTDNLAGYQDIKLCWGCKGLGHPAADPVVRIRQPAPLRPEIKLIDFLGDDGFSLFVEAGSKVICC